ncbi:MAG TPA: hypothetical protein VGD74_05230 [Vulgatibacter sp.]
MSRSRVLLQLHGESFARRYQVASLAITSAAAGDEVMVVLWFDALRRWCDGGFDEPTDAADAAVTERHHTLGLPTPGEMLREARGLGARIVACETGVRLAGVEPARAKELVDDLPGLQQILAAAKSADLCLYV